MISKTRPRIVVSGFVVAAAALFTIARFTAAQSPGASAGQAASASAQPLDFEFFKTRVEPVFLKKRAGHARCYVCHSVQRGGGTSGVSSAPTYLEKLSPGSTFWTEDQSRLNFKRVSQFVVPGNQAASKLLMHPLAPEAGGDDSHGGGRQFASQNDPDWQTLAKWVRGENTGGSSGK